MRIKKLEIFGFKSFAQRARLLFGDGITGVVGPNGCGKSNVVDAIRWCMGEMSAKHLRGRAMQDVIFAGSDHQGPAGMAEVTLTFDNTAAQAAVVPEAEIASEGGEAAEGATQEADAAPIPISGDVRQFLQYAEISVTRRLHRDGTSEYLLNKLPVRLRDVTDLFLGTGVGTRAYSIIEQGRIGFVVNARPEDRRSLIEEVAGITKFKVRKRTAERRMEATTQNLQRVDDIILELERQLQTLRRQAKAALRYRTLREEQRDLDLHAASLEYLRLYALERVQGAQRLDMLRQLEQSTELAEASEATLQANRQALQAAQAVVDAASETSFAADSGRQAAQAELQHGEEQIERCTVQGAQASQAIEGLEAQLTASRAEAAQLACEAAQLAAGATAGAAELQTAEAAASAAEQARRTAAGALEQIRRTTMAQLQRATQEGARADSLAQQHAACVAAGQQAQQETAAKEAEHQRILARQAELAARRTALIDALAAAQLAHQELLAQLKTLSEARQLSAKALAEVQRQLTQKQSRLLSLQQIAARLDGYSDGVRALLGGASSKKGAPPAFDLPTGGLVAELLQVPPEHETAIEAVLGDRLQFIWVQDAATAQAAIDYLKTHRAGRSGFMLAPALGAAADANAPSLPTGPGVRGWAHAVVGAAPEHVALLQVLLANTVLVDSLQVALDLGAAHPHLCFVSAAGDVVDRCGSVSGGSAHGAGLLAHRREMRDLQQEVEELTAQQASCQAGCDAQGAEHAALQSQATAADRSVRDLELQRLGADKDCQSADGDAARLQAHLQAQARRSTEQQAQLERLAAAQTAAQQKAQAAQADQQALDADLATQQAEVESCGLAANVAQGAVTALKISRAAEAQRAAAAQAASARVAEQTREQQQRLDQLVEVKTRAAADIDAVQERLVHGAEQLADWEAQQAVASDRLAEAREALQAATERSAAGDAALRAQRQGSSVLHDTHLACSTEQQRLQLELAQLCSQIRDRYDLELARQLADYHLHALPTPAQQQRLRELEQLLRRMGPINLTAIDECATLEKRHGFLTSQRDDLHAALEALRRAIGQMNRASKERFAAAFEAVNTMFQQVYPRLFRGGTARLELTGGEDALEAGVDIVAMPPGKKLQNVSLLSGGEKALTATALIFSIFLIKPSPFCILDEVDAPLDEANVERFNELLREISAVSQFILITHNKQTMLQADRLYGITMEEPGMSKVVSVDLQRSGDSPASERAA
jgi:chromosome segregation protein